MNGKIKVKILVDSAYKVPHPVGSIVELPDSWAARWVKNGVAEYIDPPTEIEEVSEPLDFEDEPEQAPDIPEKEPEKKKATTKKTKKDE